MFRYEFRTTVADSIFGEASGVTAVEAATLAEALEIVKSDPRILGFTLLGSIDLKPQTFLAW